MGEEILQVLPPRNDAKGAAELQLVFGAGGEIEARRVN
jgi:hypothetical protein